ncbi:MAG TPA: RES family NAD+ phosphorylase [Opitutales bacterium]|nr:RES family NAD+ phosphorylase [Opitutales bacterium]
MASDTTVSELLNRLSGRIPSIAKAYSGDVFRFVDPRFSSVGAQFAGEGARVADGRWSLQSNKHLAVYTSLEPETALAEALSTIRYYGFPDSKATPLVLVTAKVHLAKVIDLRDGKVRQRLKISEDSIRHTDWRANNLKGLISITQLWGQAIVESGIEGLIVPSAAWSSGTNIVIFPENFSADTHVKVTHEVKWPRP